MTPPPVVTDDHMSRAAAFGLFAVSLVAGLLCISLGIALIRNYRGFREVFVPGSATPASRKDRQKLAISKIVGWWFVIGGVPFAAVGLLAPVGAVVWLTRQLF